jgi:hypothetical protein
VEAVPAAFSAAAADLAAFRWSYPIEASPLDPPRRVAPHGAAVIAEITANDVTVTSGKFILFCNPAGQPAWGGPFRCVTYVTAAIDYGDFDECLGAVGWSWLLDAFAKHEADARAVGGTVTASANRHFGELADRPSSAEIELRASWTPALPDGAGLAAHLAAWQDFLRLASGLPLEEAEVVPLLRPLR